MQQALNFIPGSRCPTVKCGKCYGVKSLSTFWTGAVAQIIGIIKWCNCPEGQADENDYRSGEVIRFG